MCTIVMSVDRDCELDSPVGELLPSQINAQSDNKEISVNSDLLFCFSLFKCAKGMLSTSCTCTTESHPE